MFNFTLYKIYIFFSELTVNKSDKTAERTLALETAQKYRDRMMYIVICFYIQASSISYILIEVFDRFSMSLKLGGSLSSFLFKNKRMVTFDTTITRGTCIAASYYVKFSILKSLSSKPLYHTMLKRIMLY